MKLAIFGLTISSSWGNGHATLWRALCHALRALGHEVVFFERNQPYYESARDDVDYGCEWVLYREWETVRRLAKAAVDSADAAIVTSYCPDAREASELSLGSKTSRRIFYDLDSPVTLARLRAGESVEYLPEYGLADFDLVLSFAGGPALSLLSSWLGAREVAPLYGSVDESIYRPVKLRAERDLSYLGTYSSDRHRPFQSLFLDVARALPSRQFIVGGALYPQEEAWPRNVARISHVPPSEHPAFFASSRLTLNLTRQPMVDLGHCPSGRLFEAAACGAAIISDDWEGLDGFFEPGREILIAKSEEDIRCALTLKDEELRRMGRRARERALEEHSAVARAKQLIDLLTTTSIGTRADDLAHRI